MTHLRKIHLINFSRRLTVNTLFFLVPLYFLQIGFTGWQIGVITSLFAFAPLLFSFPTGLINDRLSIKGVIRCSLITLIIFFLLMGLSKNFLLIAILFLILGGMNSVLETSANSFYYKDDSEMDLNKKYGLLNFWLSLGAAIGVLLGGVLTYYANFRLLFFLYAAFLLSVLLLTFQLPKVHFHLIQLNDYKVNLMNKKTLLFSLFLFILTLHWGAESTVYSPFLRDFFHLDQLGIALYISLSLFVLSFASLAVCFFKHNVRFNEKLFLMSMFFSGLGQIFMVNQNLMVSFFFRCLHEVGDGFIAALIFIFIAQLFEKKSIGGSSGILIAVMTLGHMAGSLVFSPLGYAKGLQYPLIISGWLLIANTVFGYFVFKLGQY